MRVGASATHFQASVHCIQLVSLFRGRDHQMVWAAKADVNSNVSAAGLCADSRVGAFGGAALGAGAAGASTQKQE